MLRQRPLQHKRKNSQIELFHPSIHQVNKKSQEKKSTNKTNQSKKSNQNKKMKLSIDEEKSNARSILKLVQNSSRLAGKKQTIIESIDYSAWPDENCDCSNGATHSIDPNDQSSESFFLFGRRSRSSIPKQPILYQQAIQYNNLGLNYCLNMEEIVEVPDTMSNERRYQNSSNSKFYQFTSIMDKENSLKKSQHQLKFEPETLRSIKRQTLNINASMYDSKENVGKKQEHLKNFKNRKEKLPKNYSIEAPQMQRQKQMDLSELSKGNKKSKLFFFNKKEDKKSKSKEHLRNIQKQKSRQSLLLNTKSNHLLSHSMLAKKKSLSFKNEPKLKLSQQKPKSSEKPKSSQKQKDSSLHQSTKSTSQQSYCKQAKSVKRLSQSIINNPKTRNLNIGEKIQIIQQSQSKLQSQYKVLWECVGELWENSRITRYISEKNKSDIIHLKEGEKRQDENNIKLKSQIIASISSARY